MALLLFLTGAPLCQALSFPAWADFSSIINGTWAMTPRLKGYGVDHWEPLTLRTSMWYNNFTGKALILDLPNKGISPETIARRILENGTRNGWGKPALLMQISPAGLAGFGELARDFSDVSDIGIPCVDISIPVYALAKYADDNKIPLTIIVRDDDPNPMSMKWPFGVVLASAIALTACAIACFVANGYKFFHHLKYNPGMTTAKVFFVIDNAANLMRFWYVCVNPFFINKFAYTWTTMCTTTHIALSIICTLLLALKWRELLLRSQMKVVVFLQTFKWPFLILSVIIFGVEAVSSALRGHWYDIQKLSQVSWSFLVVMCFAVVVLLYVSGIQVMLQISKAIGSRRRVMQLSQTTILILISGFFLLGWAIVQMVFLIRAYALAKPSLVMTQVCFIVQMFCLFSCSFLQNWAMPTPGLNTSSASMSNQKSRDSSSKPQHTKSSRENSKNSKASDVEMDEDVAEETSTTSSEKDDSTTLEMPLTAKSAKEEKEDTKRSAASSYDIECGLPDDEHEDEETDKNSLVEYSFSASS